MNNLKDKKVYFCLGVQRFKSMVDWPSCLGPGLRLNLMVGSMVRVSCSPPGSQEMKQRRVGAWLLDIPSKAHPNDLRTQVGCYLLKVLSSPNCATS
jgi:hypothetical protein